MAFFPETAKEAASEVSKALIHSFVDNLGLAKFKSNPPPPFAPWKLTTEDPQLAIAVADEFRKIGVRQELCTIGIVKGKALKKVQSVFEGFWKDLKAQMGITGLPADVLTTPDSIGFHNYRPGTWTGNADDDDTQKALAYVQRLSSTRPISVELDPRDEGDNIMKDLQTVLALIKAKSDDTVRAEADAGNPEAAIDYALRYGFCCPNFILCCIFIHFLESNLASSVPRTDNSADSTSSKSYPAPTQHQSKNPWHTPS
jgi:hypothetical protein